MKHIIYLFLTTISISSFAVEDISTRILHIDYPEAPTENYEIMIAKDRGIYEISKANVELINLATKALESNASIELSKTETEITGIKIVESGDDLLDFYPSEGMHPMSGYTPSDIGSYDLAEELFKSLKKRTKWFTQCFNRAHVWAKQMYNSHNVNSMKILIYYTKKYRREVNGKWWFHIAPMINIKGDYFVMDKEFTRKPVRDFEWEKIFTKKLEEKGIHGHRCKVIKNIDEFYAEENQKNEYCNIQVTSMYYWEPNDMSRLVKTGIEKTEFINWELRAAAKEVFWSWRKIYKEIKD